MLFWRGLYGVAALLFWECKFLNPVAHSVGDHDEAAEREVVKTIHAEVVRRDERQEPVGALFFGRVCGADSLDLAPSKLSNFNPVTGEIASQFKSTMAECLSTCGYDKTEPMMCEVKPSMRADNWIKVMKAKLKEGI